MCGGKRKNPLETSMTEKTGARDTASETLIREIFPIVTYCGGYSAGAPPLPIPNREVKPGRADGTAPPGGRVGRCRFLQEEADCTGFRVFSLLSFYPAPSLLSSDLSSHPVLSLPSTFLSTTRPGTPVMVLWHFRSRSGIGGSAVFLFQVSPGSSQPADSRQCDRSRAKGRQMSHAREKPPVRACQNLSLMLYLFRDELLRDMSSLMNPDRKSMIPASTDTSAR